MNLAEFQAQLQALIGRPTDLRPFVCDGSPLDCRAFIVGYNPGTEMTADWWKFWDPTYGFRRSSWFEEYQQERRNRPLKPGKTRRAPVSSTRRVLDWILEPAAPIRCLETNIYAAPSAVGTSLGEPRRVTAPFDFLLRVIRPAVVLAHGDDAIAHLADFAGISFSWGQEARAHIAAQEVWLVGEAHFGRPRAGRGWSQNRATAVGERLRQLATAHVAA